MALLPVNIRFIDGAYWLIKLRWLAIVWVALTTFIVNNLLDIPFQNYIFYTVCLALAIENLISLYLLKWIKRLSHEKIVGFVTRLINFQISFDFLSLSVLIHYSGGIENPVFIFFFFHMVISSILLSKNDSYIQTTFALLLLWLIASLEYSGILNHYSLWTERENISHLYQDLYYIIVMLSVFSLSSYALVYLSTYIVSLLRKQEKAYEEANVLLQQQDKIKDEYIQRVTHNIKGHLAAILTNLSVVHDQILGPVEKKQLQFIHTTYNRTIKLTSFVNDLIKLTQMRLNDKPEVIDFSIKDLVSSVVSNQQNFADEKSIHLKYHIDHTLSTFKGNPLSLEEMMMNLIENAIRYTPNGGTVLLNVKDELSHILIQVSDTGMGIAPEELPHIFNEFYRAKTAKAIAKDGSGLGLSLVKSIVNRFHGAIDVKSKSGEGTVFTVKFPKDYKE